MKAPKRQILTCLLSLASAAPLFAQGAEPMFTESVEYIGPDLQFQRVLDLDHDGNDEVLAWYWTVPMNTNQLTVAEVDFDEDEDYIPWSFDTSMTFSSCTSRGPMAGSAIGDFDGDGFEDFAILLRNHAFVYVTRANAAPQLLAEFEWSTNRWHLECLAADLDGDGLDDLVVAGETLEAWRNDGGSFTFMGRTQGSFSISYGSTVDIDVVDLDGDGAEEVLYRTAQNSTSSISVHRLEPNGFAFQSLLNHDLQFTPHMVVGDIDGDLDRDIVLFDDQNDRYQVLRRTNQGSFTKEPFVVGGPASHFFDVDGDGDLDGLCCGGGSVDDCNRDPYAVSTYRVSLNDGTGNFDVSIARSGITTGFDGIAGVIDFDGDGDLDPIAGRTILVNHQQVGRGYCPTPTNSTGLAGRLDASGSGSMSRNDLALHGSRLPAGQTALLLLAGRADETPLGQSMLCLASPLVRLTLATTDASGNVSFPMPMSVFPSTYPGALNPQATRRFQLWHRDTVAPGFALSSALRVTFAP